MVKIPNGILDVFSQPNMVKILNGILNIFRELNRHRLLSEPNMFSTKGAKHISGNTFFSLMGL